ncbi:S-methyl-5'-thioinosine phosphorylase [Dethiothermospora halolimnae]|uniref:S-methyl-5'-thioinosine phosphorylase n=1 Tax=Dethiothermospora halolimnae TaxID=3114390 RepID=UPI003CCB9353
MNKGIIGGTGVYDASSNSYIKEVETKYGKVQVDIVEINGEEIVFLARHGKNHSNPPHLVNYRANIAALNKLGIEYIYATAAVGSCNENYAPGDIVVITDFLDFTKSRPLTFYEGGKEGVKHVDMSDPYCKNLRELFYNKAENNGLIIKGEGIYVTTEGPRFESAAEIRMYKQLGGDVVGMTNVPEVVLAKELGMCYSVIGIVTNWCTGVKKEITLHDIDEAVSKNKEKITKTFIDIFKSDITKEECNCNNALIEL